MRRPGEAAGRGRWMGTDGETVGVDAGQAPATAPGEARLRVFLSYSRKDGDFVARLAAALDGPKFEASYDASPHAGKNPELGIAAEDEWWKQLERMIAAADAMVFVVSPDSIASKVCDEEILYARTMGKRVIAVMRREIDFAKAPPRLAALNVKLRFLDDSEAGFAASLASLSDALELDAAWWREQTWLAEQVKTWRDADADKRTDWLLSAAELARAERWAARRPPKAPQISEAELDFLAASRAHQAELAEEEARKLKVRRRLQLGALVLSVLLLALSIGGGMFVVDRQRNVARSESLMLANAARGQADAGADASALRLSLLAARDTFLSPASDEAEAVLARTSAAWRLEQEFTGKPGTTDHAAISEDGTRIVSWGDNSAEISLWDAKAGTVMATLSMSHPEGGFPQIKKVVFAGQSVVASLQDLRFKAGTAVAAWRADTGAKLWQRDTEQESLEPLVSPDGRVVMLSEYRTTPDGIVEDDRGLATAVEIATGKVLFERERRAFSEAFSPDGGRVALWESDGIRVVRLSEGAIVNEIAAQFAKAPPSHNPGMFDMPPSLEPDGVAFSPDGSRLAAWTHGYAVSTWGLSSPQGVLTMVKPPYRNTYDLRDRAQYEAQPGGVMFTQDSQHLLTWSAMGVARLLLAGESEPIVIRSPMGSQWNSVTTSAMPDGLGLVTFGSSDNVLRVWKFAAPDAPQRELVHQAALTSVALQKDGRLAIAKDESLTASVWDLETGQRTARLRHDDALNGYAFAPGGRALTWGKGGVMRLWRMGGTLAEVRNPVDGKPVTDGAAVFSTDGRRVLVWDKAWLAVFDAETGEPEIKYALNDQWCSYSFELQMRCGVAPVAAPGRFVVWDGDSIWLTPAARGADIKILASAGGQSVAMVSPDGASVLGYGEDGVKVWDVATGAERFHIAKGVSLWEAMFVGDGKRFVAWSDDYILRLFDSATGKELGATLDMKPMLEMHGTPRLKASPDGRWVFVDTGSSMIWDIVELREASATLMPDKLQFEQDIAFSSQSGVFATWRSESLTLWTLNKMGEPVAGKPIETGGMLKAVRFAPDGKLFATLENDQVRLWRVGETSPFATQAMLLPEGLAFSADGERFMAWDGGNTVLLDTATGEPVFKTASPAIIWSSIGAMSALSPDGGRMIVIAPEAGAKLYDVSATQRPTSVKALRERVCGARKAGAARATAARDTWHVSPGDVVAAPTLRGREGEDVCGWSPAWWDTALDTVFGWAN